MIIKPQTTLFNELVESLNQAEGACSQLVHAAGNPVAFMRMRDTLSKVKEACIKVAPHNALIAPKTVYTEKRK